MARSYLEIDGVLYIFLLTREINALPQRLATAYLLVQQLITRREQHEACKPMQTIIREIVVIRKMMVPGGGPESEALYHAHYIGKLDAHDLARIYQPAHWNSGNINQPLATEVKRALDSINHALRKAIIATKPAPTQ